MRITSLGHACYLIESARGDSRVLLDPWLRGPAYMDQAWQAWIYPGRLEALLPASHVLFTHFHPDHFHPESLPLLNKDAQVLVPSTAGSYLRQQACEAGFARVHEIRAGESHRLNSLQVYSLRIQDHWEFLDETAYLLVEDNVAALFLADLWYIPPTLLKRWTGQFRLAFASVPWGGSIENMLVLPEGYELGSFDDYYAYGMDEATIARRNAVMEHGDFAMIASIVDAQYMIPGAFGFGWIQSGEDFVQPLPVNHWLDQEAFIASLPDARLRPRLHSMYPGQSYDTQSGESAGQGAMPPNHRVTPAMRARCAARRDASRRLDAAGFCEKFLARIGDSVARLQNASVFYRDRLAHVLSAELRFEIQVVNEPRQRFLFEQRCERFSLRAIDRPSGVKEVIYVPPSVLASLVDDWGPRWTEANFSALVKVSASGWAPYKSLSCFLG